ncbi:MAG TPA: hypothetical protein VKV20_11210 [Ktedonobacteraceae bacterium]|jgi:hypothetical protein|nr:hypothetical protein [Ktedonobacteraceae bacterium]
MNIQDQSLFAPATPLALGVGYHNVGSEGVLRASNESMVKYVRHYYGERCGHLPLNATNIRAIVSAASPEIQAQMTYLSALFGKEVIPVTFDELKREMERIPGHAPLIVPYINVPELETHLRNDFGTEAWGLPARMTHALKNKASFYTLAQEFALEGFYPPDFIVATIYDVAAQSERFLRRIEEIYQQAGVAADYPLGVMLRASEEDGNYGCCMVYENAGGIVVVHDGDAEHAQYYGSWQEALSMSQEHLLATMNVQKEARVVISRYIDFADSPGMSVVIMENRVESLGWNGQLQKPGSKACIGTSTYVPRNAYVRQMQQEYEAKTAAFFEALLRKTAQKCGIDFASIRGVANLDIMIPGELEQKLQRERKQPQGNYLAECNPRWTNYTDAIMSVLGANRKEQTIANMKAAIAAGIATIDKQPLPENADPQHVRACIAQRDEILKQDGTRVICRMAKNPMGLIFAGDIARGQQEINDILIQGVLS